MTTIVQESLTKMRSKDESEMTIDYKFREDELIAEFTKYDQYTL